MAESFMMRWFTVPAMNEDVHGELFAGREEILDIQNRDLFQKMMKHYIKHH